LAQEGFSVMEQIAIAGSRFRPLADQQGLKLSLYTDIKHDRCTGDVVRIHRVMDNILSNALKFTPAGGQVSCRITENPMANKNYGMYRFEITDTGIGMSEEQQLHAFDPFYRAQTALTEHTEGTGLGLSITKNMVDSMGGTATLHSTVGVGTTFVVELPLRVSGGEGQHPATWSNTGAGTGAAADTSGLRGLQVLVCEDHPINQTVAKRILEKAGMRVVLAENGQAGYEKFAQSRPGSYQVILMDIQMPVMNGYEATQAIRECGHPQAKTIPILAMTANAFAEDIQKSLASGMNEHLAKPLEPARLYAALRRFTKGVEGPAIKQKVLFVDDVELNIAVLTAAIDEEYEVLVAHSGRQALEVLAQNPDITAVITDIVMPEMDGIALIRTLRADPRYRRLAILANTQYGDPAQAEQLIDAGADDFLYKPTTPHVVRNRLQNVLRKYQQD
ncbi:MAG: response regulator, partial [Gemmiger sp.]|nr:response regulator [Gemmiger sp.]